jgi:glycosyltransferase involved in cell wall biosynthesis
MDPIVTIGVCMRNCEASVKEVVSGILDQDFPHKFMEVIFVDDGSKDRTLAVILDSASRMDMQVKVHHQEWKGLGPARNVVVNDTSGEYIVWVDDDMKLSRDYVRKLVGFMDQNPNVGIAKGRSGTCEEDCPIKGCTLVAKLECLMWIAYNFKHGGKPTQKLPGTAGCIYRVKAIRQVKGFDEKIKSSGEDIDAAYNIRRSNWQIYYSIDAVFYARQKATWKALWNQQFRDGYGEHYLFRKNGDVVQIHKMAPPAKFIYGPFLSFTAYKLTHQKAAFLLPLQSTFKSIALCLGFVKGQIDFFRHKRGLV